MVGVEDLKILNVLRQNSKLSVREISKRTKIPSTTVHTRLQKLKKDGVIKRYSVEFDMEKLGRPTLAYVNINVDYPYVKKKKLGQNIISDRLLKHPNVEASSAVTGRVDLIVKVRVKNIKELDKFINFLRNEEGIQRTETLVVLHDSQDNAKPLDESLAKDG